MNFFTEKSMKLQIIAITLYKSSYVLGLIINNIIWYVRFNCFKIISKLGQKDLIKNRK